MNFEQCGGWLVTFLEADCKSPAGRRLKYSDSSRIVDLAGRGGALVDLAARQGIEHGIRNGKGAIWLNLTPEQYQKLRGSLK